MTGLKTLTIDSCGDRCRRHAPHADLAGSSCGRSVKLVYVLIGNPVALATGGRPNVN